MMTFARNANNIAASWVGKFSVILVSISAVKLEAAQSNSSNSSSGSVPSSIAAANQTNATQIFGSSSQLEPIYFGAQYPPNYGAELAPLPLPPPPPQAQSVFYNNQAAAQQQHQYITTNPQGSFYTLTNDEQAPSLAPTQEEQLYQQQQHQLRLAANQIHEHQQNLPHHNQLEQVILHSPDFKIEHSNEPLDQVFEPNEEYRQQQQQQIRMQNAIAAADQDASQQKFPSSSAAAVAHRLAKAKSQLQSASSAEQQQQHHQLLALNHPHFRRRLPYVGYSQQHHQRQHRAHGQPSATQSTRQNQDQQPPTQSQQVALGDSNANIVTPQIQYKPSPVSRQPAEYNLTHLLKPGQTLANENFTASNPLGLSLTATTTSHPSAPTRPNRFALPRPISLPTPQPPVITKLSRLKSQVSVSEIEDLLRRLKPLAIGAGDKAKAEKVDEYEGGDDDKNGDSDDDDHLNPIKSSSVSASELSSGRNNSKPSASDADLVFLKSLAELGNQLRGRAPDEDDRNEQFYEVPQKKTSSPVISDAEQREKSRQVLKSIPIEVLVDHLMSGSRMASFGVQHGDQRSMDSAPALDEASTSGSGVGDDEEDEEDDEEDDQDNNGTLPLESGESAISLSRAPDPNSSLNFSSVMNHTNSWVPLGSLPLGSSLSSVGSDSKHKSGDNETQAKRPKKKRKKRRKSRKVEQDEDSGIVIGNKRLSRTDLIRLINLLNNMASKREATKERDASRKLLKFLVRVALENYKKSIVQKSATGEIKTSDKSKKSDNMRQSLRSILMGPDNGNRSTGNDSLIQLKPVGVSIKVTAEPEDKEEKEVDAKQSREKKKSFGDISEDLEQYFDGEFYEDLADKNGANKSEPSDHPKLESIELPSTDNSTSRSRRGSAKKLGYKLPVPIYGQQQIEAADEDDVELDHVRLPVSAKSVVSAAEIDRQVEGLARERDAALRGRRKSRSRGESRTRRRKRRRKKRRRRQKSNRARNKDNDDADESEEVDDEEEDRKSKSEPPRGRKSRVAPNSSSRAKKGESRKREKSTNRRKKRVREEATEPPAETEQPEEEEEEQEDEEGDAQGEGQLPAGGEGEQRGEGQQKEDKANDDPKKRKRRARRRRRRKGASNNPDDVDIRDEIPAPIVKASSSLEVEQRVKSSLAKSGKEPHHKPRASQRSNRRKLVTTGGESAARSVAQSNKRKVSVPKSKRRDEKRLSSSSSSSKTDKGEKSQKLKRRPKKRPKSNNDGEPPDDDDDLNADYYNEGTSYSNVCDDDGKCQVSVQSNNPNIGKAIETNDETGIVKQLGKWIENPDNR